MGCILGSSRHFPKECIVLQSTSVISNVHLLLYCHVLGCCICFFLFTTGPQDDCREVFHSAVCALNVLPCPAVAGIAHVPWQLNKWPLLEQGATLWPQNPWWLLGVCFSVSAAHGLMGSQPLAQLLAATVEIKVCEGLLPRCQTAPCFQVLTWNLPGRVGGGASYKIPSCGSKLLPFNEGSSSA